MKITSAYLVAGDVTTTTIAEMGQTKKDAPLAIVANQNSDVATAVVSEEHCVAMANLIVTIEVMKPTATQRAAKANFNALIQNSVFRPIGAATVM